MNVRRRLHFLLDYAIDRFKEQNADAIPDPNEFSISVDDLKRSESSLVPFMEASSNSELWTEMWAVRERDRAVACPVILRSLLKVVQTSKDNMLRQEAITYLGESWAYYEDDSTVIRTLTAACFDLDDGVQHAAVDALAKMGRAAIEAIPVLETLRSRGGSSSLCTAIENAIRRMNESETL